MDKAKTCYYERVISFRPSPPSVTSKKGKRRSWQKNLFHFLIIWPLSAFPPPLPFQLVLGMELFFPFPSWARLQLLLFHSPPLLCRTNNSPHWTNTTPRRRRRRFMWGEGREKQAATSGGGIFWNPLPEKKNRGQYSNIRASTIEAWRDFF